MPKIDTYVIVTVDTCNINETNKNEMVIFSDNRGDIPGYSEFFSSRVNRGKKIYWIGNVKEPGKHCEEKDLQKFYEGNSVEVKEIEIKKGVYSKILKKYFYDDENEDGVVVGQVRKHVSLWATERYNITIDVNGTLFKIDPQLEMAP